MDRNILELQHLSGTNQWDVYIGGEVIAEILATSEWYTGPFQPGAVDECVALTRVRNIGDIRGNIVFALYEYPGTVDERWIDGTVLIMDAGMEAGWKAYETIPDIPGGIWPLGMKVWGATESEPSWGSMKIVGIRLRR